LLISLAGIPPTTVFEFKFLFKTAPAATTARLSIVTPDRILQPQPNHTSTLIITLAKVSALYFIGISLLDHEWFVLRIEVLCAIETSLPILIPPAQSM
jgi:hypothetical protein